MIKYSKGDIVQLKTEDRRILVTKVYRDDLGVWGLYVDDFGLINARGYNSILLGEIIGNVSIENIEDALK